MSSFANKLILQTQYAVKQQQALKCLEFATEYILKKNQYRKLNPLLPTNQLNKADQSQIDEQCLIMAELNQQQFCPKTNRLLLNKNSVVGAQSPTMKKKRSIYSSSSLGKPSQKNHKKHEFFTQNMLIQYCNNHNQNNLNQSLQQKQQQEQEQQQQIQQQHTNENIQDKKQIHNNSKISKKKRFQKHSSQSQHSQQSLKSSIIGNSFLEISSQIQSKVISNKSCQNGQQNNNGNDDQDIGQLKLTSTKKIQKSPSPKKVKQKQTPNFKKKKVKQDGQNITTGDNKAQGKVTNKPQHSSNPTQEDCEDSFDQIPLSIKYSSASQSDSYASYHSSQPQAIIAKKTFSVIPQRRSDDESCEISNISKILKKKRYQKDNSNGSNINSNIYETSILSSLGQEEKKLIAQSVQQTLIRKEQIDSYLLKLETFQTKQNILAKNIYKNWNKEYDAIKKINSMKWTDLNLPKPSYKFKTFQYAKIIE